MFTTGLNEFEEVDEKANSAVEESLIKYKKTIVQYIIALILKKCKLVDNKEQARLEMHSDFNQEDILKEVKSCLTI